MSKMVKEVIHANGIDIRIYTTDFQNEYISLTDIAKYKNSEDPRFVIQNWMRNRDTIEFLGLWEILSNSNFNRVQFEAVKKDAGLNRFVMTPTKWCEEMNSIGIQSKAGRYGGTYAHSDIAFEFASWISPEFKLYIIKDYKRLKVEENSRLSLNWNLNRELSKLNYRIHTDAIKANLIPPELFELYFFDGEQIADFFLNDSNNERIKAAFLTICGYDTFDIIYKNFKRIGKLNATSDDIFFEYLNAEDALRKAEEYREIKPYWQKRFLNYFGQRLDLDTKKWVWNDTKKVIVFRNGYGKNVPEFSAECSIREDYGYAPWGAEKGKKYYPYF